MEGIEDGNGDEGEGMGGGRVWDQLLIFWGSLESSLMVGVT